MVQGASRIAFERSSCAHGPLPRGLLPGEEAPGDPHTQEDRLPAHHPHHHGMGSIGMRAFDEVCCVVGHAGRGAWLQSGCTPLLVACREGHARVVDALLVAGAALDRRDASGASALHAACAAGHADVVNVLLDSNAVPDAAVRHCTSRHIGRYTHP